MTEKIKEVTHKVKVHIKTKAALYTVDSASECKGGFDLTMRNKERELLVCFRVHSIELEDVEQKTTNPCGGHEQCNGRRKA